MLKNINPILSPELLKILSEMGHGDELVIADANFPSVNYGQRVVRADGISGTQMLDAVLSVFPLDTYSEQNFILMQLVPSDVGKVNPTIWEEYKVIASKHDDRAFCFLRKSQKGFLCNCHRRKGDLCEYYFEKRRNLKAYKRRYALFLQSALDWDDQQGLSHPIPLCEPRLPCF